jgi:hypothetical protein
MAMVMYGVDGGAEVMTGDAMFISIALAARQVAVRPMAAAADVKPFAHVNDTKST